MPYKAPGSLEVDDTYAIAAYILSLNGIRAADGKLDKQSMPKIKMPNRDGFAPDPEFSAEKRTVIVHGMRVSRLGAVSSLIAALWLSADLGVKVMAADGLTTIKSAYSAQEPMARLEAAVTAKGMTVFAHIDHAAAAVEAGLPLRPTDLLIFGSPKGGTPVMQSVQIAGIDLPLKALVWQDEAGITWLSYNTPTWIAERHGADAQAAIRGMTEAIEAIAATATSESTKR
jgi:uncharacterized protein (DUF302 family)